MTKPQRAPIGLAIIAKDSEDTLPHLLKSVRPYVEQIVVGVDVLTKDRTKQAAKKGGADIVFPLQVSDWHECPHHGRVMAQHFARARTESFSKLDPTLPFLLWLDADDVLEGAEMLAAACAGMPDTAAGMWFPYEYSHITRADGQRTVNTLFHRERLLRTVAGGEPVVWTWEGRVHETVKPDRDLAWLVNDEIRVVHQPGVHQTPDSAKRNTLLLEIDYEEDPNSARTIFYLGNQHFAMGNWEQAASWYELLTSGIGKNPYELWQAYLYMSHAYERMDNIDAATQTAFGAMDVVPQHPEPYLQLARLSNLTGQFDKTLFWDNLGQKMQEPPFFVFKNPLDYNFNRLVVRGDALANQGRITEARQVWEQAGKVFMDDRLAGALADVREKEDNLKAAQAFIDLAKPHTDFTGPSFKDDLPLRIYEGLAPGVKAFGRTRDLVMPTLLHGRPESSPRIVFWCGRSLEPWGPPSLNEQGIGGSETAVVEIAKRFAADGWTVDVYNDADRYEGLYDGVGYWDCRRLGAHEKADVFVSWRNPVAHGMIEAKQSVLWCHDLNYGSDVREHFHQWDHVLGVSDWHADMLRRYYGQPGESADHHFDYVPNGVDLARFDPSIKKVSFRCVYASSPDRGLRKLLEFWPQIVEAEPTAELHVAYGWNNIEKMGTANPGLLQFKHDVEAMIASTPKVVWRGRLGQQELAQLYSESVAWLYPTGFLEVSCISAMEAMAGGAIPVTTHAGALPETIGDAGLLIPGPPQSRAYGDLFPKAALGVMTELNTQLIYSQHGRIRAQQLTWDAAFQRWLAILGVRTGRENGQAEIPTRELVTV